MKDAADGLGRKAARDGGSGWRVRGWDGYEFELREGGEGPHGMVAAVVLQAEDPVV